MLLLVILPAELAVLDVPLWHHRLLLFYNLSAHIRKLLSANGLAKGKANEKLGMSSFVITGHTTYHKPASFE